MMPRSSLWLNVQATYLTRRRRSRDGLLINLLQEYNQDTKLIDQLRKEKNTQPRWLTLWLSVKDETKRLLPKKYVISLALLMITLTLGAWFLTKIW